MKNRNHIKSFVMDYLKKTIPNFEKKGKTFTCPTCSKQTANIFPPNSHQVFCFEPNCQKQGDVIDICRRLEFDGNADIPDEDIGKYLIDMFDIKINESIPKLFDKYEKWQWDMVPVNLNGKESWIEQEWQKKSHKSRDEWEKWIGKVNMGVQTGKKSNTICIDFDFVSSDLKKRIYNGNPTEKMLVDAKKEWDGGLQKVKETLPFLDWETVSQNTFGGIHLFYEYNSDIPKTAFDYEGVHIDIEADGGQVVIEPSIVGSQNRQIVGDTIKPMPEKVKEFILKYKTKDKQQEIEPTEIVDAELTFENLNSNRNNTFIKLYGELRKDSQVKVAYGHLCKFNKLLDKQLPLKELQAMARQAEKYHSVDIKTVCAKIIDHFKMVQHEVHLRDLKEVLGIERKDIEEALRYLLDEKKIYKLKKDLYKLITDVEWRTDFMTISKPLDIVVPYFNDIASFNRGSLIVVGGGTGRGKCITNGLLATNEGLIDIKDVGKDKEEGVSTISNKFRIYSGVPKEIIYRKTNYFYKELTDHTIKIKTYNGFELEGTPEHPILVRDNEYNHKFVELQNLKINDNTILVVPNMYAKSYNHSNRKMKPITHNNIRFNIWDVEQDMNLDIAKLFGYILGDGSVQNKNVKIYQNNKDKHVISDILNTCERLKLKPKIYYRTNHQIISINSVDFLRYVSVKLFGLNVRKKYNNVLSPNRKIPKAILRANKECQLAFIEALLNCESSIKKTNNGCSLEITMASKQIIDTLHLMLLNLGIVARKTEKKVKQYPDNTYWRLYLNEYMTYNLFNINKPCKYKDIDMNGYYQNNTKIKWLGNNQYSKDTQFCDKIVSIEHDYTKKFVYDFNMDSDYYKKKNQFWSNGFISHNTHIVGNMIEHFVKQGICPKLITTEADSGVGEIALARGMKEGDFKFFPTSDPLTVPFNDGEVRIIDWLKAPNSEFFKLDTIYESLNNKLVDHGGLLIVFAQLKSADNKFYSEDMVMQYASLVAKFFYPTINGIVDNLNPYFDTCKIRRSKSNHQYKQIPLKYIPETKELRMK